MSTGPGDDWLADLRQNFVRGSGERLETLARMLTLLEAQPGDPGPCREVMQQFHKLAGSGATFGFERVTTLGREGEDLCLECLNAGRRVTADDLRTWWEIRAKLASEFSGNVGERTTIPAPATQERPPVPEGTFEVLVVEDDDDLRESLVKRLSAQEMSVRGAVTLAEGFDAVRQRLPDGAIVDIRLPDGSGYDLVERIRSWPGGEGVAIVATSARAGFLDRVEALRCGADVAFPKPFELEALVRRLRQLLEEAHSEQPRVLAVEDDLDQAEFFRTVLGSAGYAVRVCDDPRALETDLIAFEPDVVLMDILLPGTTGYDLVRFLRQDPRYSNLPVLFVSTEGQLGDRIRSTRAGGDDHLVKPVAPALLLASVAARVQRARALRNTVDHDGLTGLLNRAAFLERAETKVSQVRRKSETPPIFVMLDLDKFHAVNERFGHPEGDRVLASLGTLLRRRLRRSDTIGRYGGEEFAILLEDLGEEEAVRLMQRMLEEFSATGFVSSKGEPFHASFSAGVAAFLPGKFDLRSWISAADDALFRAKAAGRRQVLGASVS